MNFDLYYEEVVISMMDHSRSLASIVAHLVEEAVECQDEALKETLDESALELELGDALFCALAAIYKSGLDPYDVMSKNYNKLEARLANGYSKKAL